MVHRCCIPSCGMNVRVPEAKGLSYHTFPVKEPQRHKWIAAIIPYMDKPKFKVVQGYTRICSRHFTKKDYSIDSKKRARLSSNAVPSIFPEKSTPLLVTENSNTACSELNSTDDTDYTEKHLPTKIQKCASDYELSASNLSEPEIPDNSVQEEMNDPTWQPNPTKKEFVEPEPKDPTRRRKIKKNRVSKRKSTSPARNVRRKISTNSANSVDELNIEHVGEAFADIKLSKLLSMGPPAPSEPKFAPPKDWKLDRTENVFRNQQQLLGSSAGSVDSLCSSTDDNTSATPISNSLPLASDFGSLESSIEPELLLSIQAVNLNKSLVRDNVSSGDRIISETCTSSESESDRLPLNHDFEESLLETLTLNDFSLLDRLDTKLPFDITSPLLNTENFSTSILDDVQYNVFNSPFQSPFDFDFSSEDNLISEFQNMSAKSDGTEELTPVKKPKPACIDPSDVQDTATSTTSSRTAENGNGDQASKSDSPTCTSDGRTSPVENDEKRRKTVRSSFSIKRFLESEADIEYYTGFSSYAKFEAFFKEIQEFVLLEKGNREEVKSKQKQLLEDTELSKTSSHIPTTSRSEDNLFSDIFDGNSPSQGALSHIDELFLTIIRLRRKLPDKILGHMFCVTRPAVTRTVRSWTSLLTKILEKSNKLNKEETEKDLNETDDTVKVNVVEIPQSVRRLLESGLAKSILSNTRSVGLSRKTSCSSSHNTSKSKRPKKEKAAIHAPEPSSSGPTSPADNSAVPGSSNENNDGVTKKEDSSIINTEAAIHKEPVVDKSSKDSSGSAVIKEPSSIQEESESPTTTQKLDQN